MFFLQGFVSDSTAVDPLGNLTYVDTIKISNAIFDHLNLINDLDDSFKIPSWNEEQTLMNAYFNNSIDAGNVGELIGNISYLAIQRKEEGSEEWITLNKIYKNTSNQTIQSQFTMYDTYTQSGVKYLYQILPVDDKGNVGNALQSDIVSIFDGAYIADANNIFKITNEYELTNQTNQKSAIYEPLGSKYPFVTYNAETNYDSGTFTAVLLAPTSQNQSKAYIDRMAQVNLEKKFNSWLTNGRPKVLKDFNGRLKIVTIVDTVQNQYYKELGNGLCSTSCSFVEVGELTQKYISKLNMGNFPLYSNNEEN